MNKYCNYTDMRTEVIDAIKQYDVDIYIDCLLFLANTAHRSDLEHYYKNKLSDMGRCRNCGTELEYVNFREYHDEIDAYEEFVEPYCPECDLGGIDI